MLVWGGYSGGYLATGSRYDPAADAWTAMSATGVPVARYLHTAVWTGSRMVVWGGEGAASVLDTGGRYDPAANTWAATATAGVPAARAYHRSIWTGSFMLVWGGQDEVSALASGGRYALGQSSDDDLDGLSECGGDCDDTSPAIFPGAPALCDGINNDCSDPAWPSLAGTNEQDDDGDLLSECAGDCDDGDALIAIAPGEPSSLVLTYGSGSTTLLAWTTPPNASGWPLAYDTLRSTVPTDFTGAAICLESDDGSDTAASDAASPPDAGAFFYLVRAVSRDCRSPLGADSQGVPTAGRVCP
jgi:hypothetical protein